MKIITVEEWKERARLHAALVCPMADWFLHRRGLGQKHPVYDFLFTYYSFSPAKLKQWVPSFEEGLEVDGNHRFNDYWFTLENGILQLNRNRLHPGVVAQTQFVEELCLAILDRVPRFGCYGLHEWAMVYQSADLRHEGQRLRLSREQVARFVESQNLCCTHYDAYRFFTPEAEPLNAYRPTLETRVENEQGGCLHANMDIYKWATKLWPWIGSDFIGKAFLLAVEGREIDMRASPYDLEAQGYPPIRIETEGGRKEYQALQHQYAAKAALLRQELGGFCERLLCYSNELGLCKSG